NVEIIFGRRVRRDTLGTFRTAIDRRDNGGVLLNVFYRHSRSMQYLKDDRATGIDTAINHARDLGCQPRPHTHNDFHANVRARNPDPTATGSPTTASASPSSTPRSTTGSSPRSSQPTNHKHPASYEPRCPQSTDTSTTT